jgi:hypothetical protein
LEKIKKEMYTKNGKYQITYLVSNWLITVIGTFYFNFFKTGKLYKYRVSQLSDTTMLDGFLNTVISGTDAQIDKLKIRLDALESKSKIIYGMHITHASIMSCYIEDRKEKHMHFF